MPQCAFWGCSSFPGQLDNNGKKLSFHSFPLKDAPRLRAWVHASGRQGFSPSQSSRVCSLHFNPDDFERDLQLELMGQDPKKRQRARQLKPQSVPLSVKELPGAGTTAHSKPTKARELSIKRSERAAHQEVSYGCNLAYFICAVHSIRYP